MIPQSSRTAPPKPQKGAYAAKRKRTKRMTVANAKRLSKARDGWRCQFPQCLVGGPGFVESAHLENSGMGGRVSVGSAPDAFVTLCAPHHRRVHAETVRIDTFGGGGGLVEFFGRVRIGDPFIFIGYGNRSAEPAEVRD